MKMAVIGAGKWGLVIIGRSLNKVQRTALTLCLLQQQAQAASRFDKTVGGKFK